MANLSMPLPLFKDVEFISRKNVPCGSETRLFRSHNTRHQALTLPVDTTQNFCKIA